MYYFLFIMFPKIIPLFENFDGARKAADGNMAGRSMLD
jgi:hypothetical protein